MVTLERVVIPGLADMVRKERTIREAAFLYGLMDNIAGLPVLPMTLRHYHYLSQLRNGYIEPCRFISNEEAHAHALQYVWVLSPEFAPPAEGARWYWLKAARQCAARARFIRRAVKVPAKKLAEAIDEHVTNTFYDAPRGRRQESGDYRTPYASTVAHIVDMFAEGGYTLTPDEIMALPLTQVWQYFKLIRARTSDYKPGNPSDEYTANYLAAQSGRN